MPEQIPLSSKSRKEQLQDLAATIARLQEQGIKYIPVTPEDVDLYNELYRKSIEDDRVDDNWRGGRGYNKRRAS